MYRHSSAMTRIRTKTRPLIISVAGCQKLNFEAGCRFFFIRSAPLSGSSQTRPPTADGRRSSPGPRCSRTCAAWSAAPCSQVRLQVQPEGPGLVKDGGQDLQLIFQIFAAEVEFQLVDADLAGRTQLDVIPIEAVQDHPEAGLLQPGHRVTQDAVGLQIGAAADVDLRSEDRRVGTERSWRR